MNDQYLLDSYLLLLKSTVEVYVHGTLESSNKKSRNLLKKCLDETMSMQATTYDLMKEYGYYKVKNIDSNTIKQTIDKLNNS